MMLIRLLICIIYLFNIACVRSLFEVVMATGSIPVMELEVASK